MTRPSRADVLAIIAELEGLEATLVHFPELTRDELLEVLGHHPEKKKPKSSQAAPAAEAVELLIHTDGACRGNPGPSSVGATLDTADGKRRLAEVSERIGRRTNNYAEYMAVKRALEKAIELGAHRVHLRADSQLAVRQLTGQYRVKNEALRPLFNAIKALEDEIPAGVTYEHVRREKNTEADQLANDALDNEY